MKKHYKCEECEQEHRRNALILTHGKLYCRPCFMQHCEVIPPKPRKSLRNANKPISKPISEALEELYEEVFE